MAFVATARSVVLKIHTVFRGMLPGYRSVSAADVKHGMVLALRGVPLCDQGIRFITGGLTAVPPFSERGIRFIDGERGYGGVYVGVRPARQTQTLPLSENQMWQLIDKGLSSFFDLILFPFHSCPLLSTPLSFTQFFPNNLPFPSSSSFSFSPCLFLFSSLLLSSCHWLLNISFYHWAEITVSNTYEKMTGEFSQTGSSSTLLRCTPLSASAHEVTQYNEGCIN